MTLSPKTVPVASVLLRWLGPGEGGRKAPPAGPFYAPTAHFADDTVADSFSIIIQAPEKGSFESEIAQQVNLRLLAPERLPDVVRKLVPGRQVIVTEGTRVVAIGRVESVQDGTPVAPFAVVEA